MSFLAPLFLLGSLAVAAPILYHLIRQTTRQRQLFSSLMFLRPTPPRVTRRSRLEYIWLLLLRCLVLCLLALAFARPFLKEALPFMPPSAVARRVMILVDRSASMQRPGLWAEALKVADRQLQQVSAQDTVSVWLFDTALSPLVTFDAWSAAAAGDRVALARSQLAAVQPGWGASDVGQALTSAAEILDEAGDQKTSPEQAQRQIVLVSDLQEGSRLVALQAYEWPRNLRVSVETVKAKRPTNAGLHVMPSTDSGAVVAPANSLRLRIANAGDSQRELFQVQWGGGITDAPRIEAYVPPGQSRAASITNPPSGMITGSLVLTGDDEPFDNTAWWVADPVRSARVLFLGDDDEKNPAQALYYLKRAFVQTAGQKIEVTSRANAVVLAAGDTDSASLTIVSDRLPGPQAAEVARVLKAGSTVLLVLKSSAAADTISRLTGKEPLAVKEASVRDYALLGQIDFQHPLLSPFADPRFSDFTRIHFWKHREVDLAPFGDAARVLARFDGGAPALAEVRVGNGTLLLLTSGWEPGDSQLALSSKFVPLLLSVLDRSGALQGLPTRFQVGDPVAVHDLEALKGLAAATVRKPDGTEASVAKGQAFTQTDVPGIYSVTSVNPPWQFAVNLAPEESRTAPIDPDELVRLGVPLAVDTPTPVARTAESKVRAADGESENRQKLWRWLIAVVLGVVVLETWLAGRLQQRKNMAPVET